AYNQGVGQWSNGADDRHPPARLTNEVRTVDANTNTASDAQNPDDALNITDSEQAERKLYATRDEAESNLPADKAKLRVCELTKHGATLGFIWARGYADAIVWYATSKEGIKASFSNKTAQVTKEAVAAKLATFTDDELAAMGLTRKPQKGG